VVACHLLMAGCGRIARFGVRLVRHAHAAKLAVGQTSARIVGRSYIEGQTTVVSGSKLRCGVIGCYRYVWSAAELQAETEDDGLVCANVFGLWWSLQLRAMMDSARSLPY